MEKDYFIFDINSTYSRFSSNHAYTCSIYDVDTIISVIKENKFFSDDLLIIPVADYAIPSVMSIYKELNLKYFDYSFLTSKTETLDVFKKCHISTINVISARSLNNHSQYILNAITGSESKAVSRIQNSNVKIPKKNKYFLTEFMSGKLYNIDYEFCGNAQFKVIDLYRRINDSRLRTILTISNIETSQLSNLAVGLGQKLNAIFANYRGYLTVDVILKNSEFHVIEASPFHHKPWLRMLNNDHNKQFIFQITEYENQYQKLQKLHKLSEEIIQFTNIRNSVGWQKAIICKCKRQHA